MPSTALKSVTSSAQTIKYFLSIFGDTDQNKKRLLEGTGITPGVLKGRKSRVTAYAELRMVENIGKVHGPDWVIKNANHFIPQVYGALGTAILNAPTAGDALDVATRFGYMGASTLFLEQFRSGSGKAAKRVLALNVAVETGPAAQAEREIALIGMSYLLRKKLGKDWQQAEIWIQDSEISPAGSYKKVFSCPVKFDQNRCAIALPEKLCERVLADIDTTAFNKAVLGLYQMSTPKVKSSEIIANVKNFLASITDRRPNVDEAARTLGMSRRTLNRKLNVAGSSFRELLDATLKTRAQKLLSDTNLSRAQISERLGYNDQASFSRALKRWKDQN